MHHPLSNFHPPQIIDPSAIIMAPIPAATLLSSVDHVVPGQMLVTELFFKVPLDYANPSGKTITLFGRRATKKESPIVAPDEHELKIQAQRPYMVYLEGGPGFGCVEPQDHSLTRFALQRGYQMLYLDHRGTGLSTPVSTDMLCAIGGVDEQFKYLTMMRADNTVRDLEAVRQCLTEGWPESRTKWSTFGQSYGGFVNVSYLSLHPEGLREAFVTGGLAPVGRTIDEVYESLFDRITLRNKAYYEKFPEDIAAVRQLAGHIKDKGGEIPLPGGGKLTLPRLLTMGLAFGFHGGFDKVHSMILQLKTSLDQFGSLSRASLTPLESFTPFDTNIIYAIIHEALYMDGPGKASDWSAQRVCSSREAFKSTREDLSATQGDSPLYFTGENVFPFHFDTYSELVPLKEVAEKLAAFDQWPRLYDEEQLKRNEVPVYAASYVEDMYVDYNFAKDTAKMIGAKVFETNILYHNAVRSKSDEVLRNLFRLRDESID